MKPDEPIGACKYCGLPFDECVCHNQSLDKKDKKCFNCDIDLNGNYSFCPFCGEKLN